MLNSSDYAKNYASTIGKSLLSSNEAEFNNAKPPYQEALKIVATITSSSTYKRTRSAGRKVEKETLFGTTHRFQVTSRQTWENPS